MEPKLCNNWWFFTVKIYKHGYKNIKYVNSFKYNSFILKDVKDFYIKWKIMMWFFTENHAILVDEVTDEEIKNVGHQCDI